jgi:hypothetical protein
VSKRLKNGGEYGKPRPNRRTRVIRFNPFVYSTLGRRSELTRGMAGKDPVLFQRMLSEIANYVTFADEAGYAGWGHPEHHLQIEGFEASNEPTLMGMWVGQHSKRLRVITCGFVSTAHNPLRTAESIATMDHMLQGRFGVGLVQIFAPLHLLHQKCSRHAGVVLGLQRRTMQLTQVGGAAQWVFQTLVSLVDPHRPLHGQAFFSGSLQGELVGVHLLLQRFPLGVKLRAV